VYGKILLGIGYLSAPFAGPGSAVITAAGWLAYGSETKNPTLTSVGLVGLVGVAGVLTGYYGISSASLAGAGGVLLLLYHILGIAALWIVGIKSGNTPLKAAAMLLAVSWLLAVSGAASVEEAATAASGQVVDWGGLSWANQAARNIIESIGGTATLAKAFAAAGAVFAAIGIMTIREPSAAASEDAIFSMGTY
jgi:hypothetical protein